MLAALESTGFALAGGSALLDYDVVTRETEDIDAFLNSTSPAAFTDAAQAVIATCVFNGWDARIVRDQDWDKQIVVTIESGDSTVVQMIHHQRSAD